jgi:hypothetical protein
MVSLCVALFAFPAYAAPEIKVTKGNPSTQVTPPYTMSFSVKDSNGITSIIVNGRELGPGGAAFYDADWTTYYNGTISITATNSLGDTSKTNVELTNIATAISQPSKSSVQESEVQTVPSTTIAPTTAAPTTSAPTTSAPTTSASTTAAMATTAKSTTAPPPTAAITTAESVTEEQTTVSDSENVPVSTDQTVPEAENASQSMEGLMDPETVETQPEITTTETTAAPAYPPDSYKLYEGGKKNNLIPIIFIIGCVITILYFIITIRLNKKRLKLYKKMREVLLKRKQSKVGNEEPVEEFEKDE